MAEHEPLRTDLVGVSAHVRAHLPLDLGDDPFPEGRMRNAAAERQSDLMRDLLGEVESAASPRHLRGARDRRGLEHFLEALEGARG